MGLFTQLLLLPLAPVRMTAWVAEQIAEQVEREAGEEPIRRELTDLDARHAAGEIPDDEYAAQQDALLEALLAAREAGAGGMVGG